MSQYGKPLDASELSPPFEDVHFDFETTVDLSGGSSILGQERALDSIRFALGVDNAGYNLFAAGPQGTGRHDVVRQLLDQEAAHKPQCQDWFYVHNFAEERRPKAISVPAVIVKGIPTRSIRTGRL